MDKDIQNLFLNLKVKDESNRDVLYLNDMELKGVESFLIKKSSDTPYRMAELELKLMVIFD